MKYLIVGLGNIGAEYQDTRHNTGFKLLDAFAKASNIVFSEGRYGATAQCRVKNAELVLLKPNTYMNSVVMLSVTGYRLKKSLLKIS